MSEDRKRRVQNLGKLLDQFTALYQEADYGCAKAEDILSGNPLPFFNALEEMPKLIRRIEYRVNRIKKLWKEC